MRVSIVTPVRNGVATLSETLGSVLAQDDPELEHVIVDGGSTDGTLEIIRNYDYPRLKWVSEPDEGISDAFNKGIRLSTGEIIGIISADDQLWPGALAHVRRVFEAHPDADVVYGNAVYLEEGGGMLLSRPEPDLRNIRRHSPLRHAAVFVRRSAYEKYGEFDLAYRLAMDYELILRFHTLGARFVYVDEVLALIRMGGVSTRRFTEAIAETRDISIRYGYSPPAAYIHTWRQNATIFLRGKLERMGLRWLADRCRAHSSRIDGLPKA